MEINLNGVVIHFDTRTTEEWKTEAKVIPEGFLCVEKADGDKIKLKVGDGERTYEQLPYAGAEVNLDDYYDKGEIDEKLESYISKEDTLTLNCTLPEE